MFVAALVKHQIRSYTDRQRKLTMRIKLRSHHHRICLREITLRQGA